MYDVQIGIEKLGTENYDFKNSLSIARWETFRYKNIFPNLWTKGSGEMFLKENPFICLWRL